MWRVRAQVLISEQGFAWYVVPQSKSERQKDEGQEQASEWPEKCVRKNARERVSERAMTRECKRVREKERKSKIVQRTEKEKKNKPV